MDRISLWRLPADACSACPVTCARRRRNAEQDRDPYADSAEPLGNRRTATAATREGFPGAAGLSPSRRDGIRHAAMPLHL